MVKPRGIILYQGPSKLDGEPIVVIATLQTNNPKTGNMVQTYIIRSDINPVEVSKQALDGSICGNCPQRWSKGGACYVNIGQAPNSIYKAYKRGVYPLFNSDHLKYFAGRKLRLGAYGDPAAVPIEAMLPVLHVVDGWTGYTHQLRHKGFDSRWLDYCMVSADTPRQADVAIKRGGRYFRVTKELDLRENEIECLADSKGINCADCLKCDGAFNTSANIVIAVHGSRSKRFLNNDIIARG